MLGPEVSYLLLYKYSMAITCGYTRKASSAALKCTNIYFYGAGEWYRLSRGDETRSKRARCGKAIAAYFPRPVDRGAERAELVRLGVPPSPFGSGMKISPPEFIECRSIWHGEVEQ